MGGAEKPVVVNNQDISVLRGFWKDTGTNFYS